MDEVQLEPLPLETDFFYQSQCRKIDECDDIEALRVIAKSSLHLYLKHKEICKDLIMKK